MNLTTLRGVKETQKDTTLNELQGCIYKQIRNNPGIAEIKQMWKETINGDKIYLI